MGMMQLWVAEQYGGPNGNLTMVCIAREEISKVSPACASIAGLNSMFIMPLLHFGSEEQRKKYLPIIANGGVVTAIAISEPQAGSEVSAMSTRAKKDGDCYILNGRKQWCSYGVAPDDIGMMAGTSDSPGPEGFSGSIVDPKQFKKSSSEFQGVQFMLADMAIQIEAARALVYECARAGDAGDWKRLNVLASMAKCFGSDIAMKVTTDAVQIFGGYGYTMDYPVERIMRDAKLTQIFDGTNHIQRVVIARDHLE